MTNTYLTVKLGKNCVVNRIGPEGLLETLKIPALFVSIQVVTHRVPMPMENVYILENFKIVFLRSGKVTEIYNK